MPLSIAGHVIEEPIPIWRQYARDHGRTIRQYDLADPGNPNALTPDEMWISRIIGSHLRYSERDELVARAAGAQWTRVPAGADLTDADPATPGGLFTDAAYLYWWFTSPPIHGVRVAKIHKILHFKRRDFYPILDKKLKAIYAGSAQPWIGRLSYLGKLTEDDSPPYWCAFREDLTANLDDLERYRQLLAEEEDHAVQLVARLTCLRMLDIIAWSISGRNKALH